MARSHGWPSSPSSLDFIEGRGRWVLNARQDELVSPAVGREEDALDGRGFGQRRCPFADSARIKMQRGTHGKCEMKTRSVPGLPELDSYPGLGRPKPERLRSGASVKATPLISGNAISRPSPSQEPDSRRCSQRMRSTQKEARSSTVRALLEAVVGVDDGIGEIPLGLLHCHSYDGC